MKSAHLKYALAPLAASALTILLGAQAHAESKFSVGADIGQTISPEANVSGFSVPINDDTTYGVNINYDLAGPFRLQGELRHINGSVGGLADIRSTIYFGNAILDLNGDGKIQPILGIGIGQGETEVDVFGFGASADGLAWQAFGGAGLKLTESLTAEVLYRHIDMGSLDFGFGADVDAGLDAVTVGLRARV